MPGGEWQGVPQLQLELADQYAFLERHGSKVGLHARNIRSIAAPVSQIPCTVKKEQ